MPQKSLHLKIAPLSNYLFLGLITLSLATSCHQSEDTINTTHPNIIYIMADDLGYGDVGFNGQEHIQTPNIDRLATEGMVFTQHYAGSTVCGPSRSVLLTGQHTGRTRVRGNPTWTQSGNPVDLQPQDITIGKELKRAGYVNGIIGKWGMDETFTTGHPLDQGFDYFYGYRTHVEAHHYYPEFVWRNRDKVLLEGNVTDQKIGQYTHDLFTEESLNFIKANQDTSFFLMLSYTVPHYELTVPEDSKLPYLEKGWPERQMKAGHYHHDEEGNVTYAGMVSRLDRDVGRVLDLLKELGLEENTLVIFTSDNGPVYDNGFFNSNGGFRGMKRDLYEGGIRVPFIAKWTDKIEAGSRSDHVSAFWDFLPTVCELAGLQPEAVSTGISYLPTLLGDKGSQQEHDYLYWEFNEAEGPIQAVRSGEWKIVKKFESSVELYDLEKDPLESKNLAANFPQVLHKLTGMLDNARTEHDEFPLKKIKRE
ncbi:arylsulfatase [Lunatibacter salilacus]|uniref:arylsulfatase n=1 Tax=Lunatibacter salilacus TaxID=2483804 RepID=UPI00131A960A|nr:arylsulfatase [Lunatibacter salilacus]